MNHNKSYADFLKQIIFFPAIMMICLVAYRFHLATDQLIFNIMCVSCALLLVVFYRRHFPNKYPIKSHDECWLIIISMLFLLLALITEVVQPVNMDPRLSMVCIGIVCGYIAYQAYKIRKMKRPH